MPATCVGTTPSKGCQPTDKRIYCIVECAIGQNYPSLQHKHGKRKYTQQAVMSQMMFKPELGDACDAQHGDDIHEKYVSRRKGGDRREQHRGPHKRKRRGERESMCGLQGAMRWTSTSRSV